MFNIKLSIRSIYVLKNGAEIEIVGEANSGEDVVNQAKQLNPENNILIFTMFKDDQSVFTAMRMGAKGYILKDSGKEEIIRATNKEIAEHLNISNKTVSNYVTNILNKLQVSSREEAIQIVNISNMDQQ